ncbi:MAG: transposase [Candidatus Azotimanducaceae bacterium]|jgi:transposase
MMRLRELAIKQKAASSNQIKALLLEFNIRVSPKNGGLKGVIESPLEDAENGFSLDFRRALNAAWELHLGVLDSIRVYDRCLETSIDKHDDCKRLLKLEGVGTLNAINLYIALGCADLGVFNKGKEASACIGLTPLQHSSGGVTKLGHITENTGSSTLRSQLITGAMAVVNQIVTRTAVTKKEA